MAVARWLSLSLVLHVYGLVDVVPRVDNTMTDTPTGPMTRSRAKAMQDKVNSLLSLHQFNLSMDGLLPQADTLCILRYEPDEKDLEDEGGVGQDDEDQARGNGD